MKEKIMNKLMKKTKEMMLLMMVVVVLMFMMIMLKQLYKLKDGRRREKCKKNITKEYEFKKKREKTKNKHADHVN